MSRLRGLAWRAGLQAMRLLPLAAWRRVFPRPVLGLCYHVVSDAPLPHVRRLYPWKSTAQFEADLRWLKRRFRLVSYDELEEIRASGAARGNAVHLSFDDGYAECFSVVRPLLLAHGVPATFFLVTDALDNRRLLPFNRVSLCLDRLAGLDAPAVADALRAAGEAAGRAFASVAEFAAWARRGARGDEAPVRAALDRLSAALRVDEAAFLGGAPYLTTEQARQLAADGFTLGGHTRGHLHLARAGSDARVEEEIVESCRRAAELSGQARVPFAFPYDGEGVSRALVAGILRRHPWIGPVFGTGQVQADAEFIVNRMIVDTPPRLDGARSSLPAHLRSAYLDALLRAPRRPAAAGAALAPAMEVL